MKKLEIIFEDDDLVAVNKPANLLTIPDRFDHNLPNLFSLLLRDREEIYTVHRLDRFTSGGIIFAKNKESHRTLSQAFMNREPEKYYLAIVDGVPHQPIGEIDAPLSESMAIRGKMLVNTRGKESKSSYELVAAYQRFSMLKVRIFTGRTHQVRVHLAHIGHPLMVDSLYGKREEFYLSEIKGRKYRLKQGEEEKPLLKRHPLHAAQLIISHPTTGKALNLQFEMPKDMRAIIKQLSKVYGSD